MLNYDLSPDAHRFYFHLCILLLGWKRRLGLLLRFFGCRVGSCPECVYRISHGSQAAEVTPKQCIQALLLIDREFQVLELIHPVRIFDNLVSIRTPLKELYPFA